MEIGEGTGAAPSSSNRSNDYASVHSRAECRLSARHAMPYRFSFRAMVD